MANRDTPMGFRAANGTGTPHQVRRYLVTSANSTAIFIGDVIDAASTGGAIPAAADAGVSALGIAVAVYDSNGVPCGHPLSSVSTKYLTASVAGYVDVDLALPGAVFIGQGQTGQTPAAADVNATTDHVQGTGDTTTARSRHELNFSDLNTGLQFRILGLVDEPGNAWGEHAEVYVVFNESALGASGAAGV